MTDVDNRPWKTIRAERAAEVYELLYGQLFDQLYERMDNLYGETAAAAYIDDPEEFLSHQHNDVESLIIYKEAMRMLNLAFDNNSIAQADK